MKSVSQNFSLYAVGLFFALLTSALAGENKKEVPSEVIVIVTMNVIEGNSKQHIAEFTQKYAEFVDKTEPDTLGWSYHQSGKKVTLIERYKNEEANINTAKNISPGGIRNQLLKDQLKIFTIEKVTVFGGFTQKLIDFNSMTAEKLQFKFPFEYNPIISGTSKNAKWIAA